MRTLIASLLVLLVSLPAFAEDDGLVKMQSPHSVTVTGDNLEKALINKGMALFARIDHSKGAENAGLSLAPTEQFIFGNPKIGTPLMHCQHTVAIDLPQNMLIWEDEAGQAWIAYNNPEYVKQRHNVQGCDEVFAKVAGALANFAKAATAQ